MAKFKSAISTIAALLMGTNAFAQTSLDNTCWVASDGGRPWPVQLTENGMAFHAQFVAPVAIWCLGVQRPRNLFDAMLSGSSFEGTYTACATIRTQPPSGLLSGHIWLGESAPIAAGARPVPSHSAAAIALVNRIGASRPDPFLARTDLHNMCGSSFPRRAA
jgi:hypothetical protein